MALFLLLLFSVLLVAPGPAAALRAQPTTKGEERVAMAGMPEFRVRSDPTVTIPEIAVRGRRGRQQQRTTP